MQQGLGSRDRVQLTSMHHGEELEVTLMRIKHGEKSEIGWGRGGWETHGAGGVEIAAAGGSRGSAPGSGGLWRADARWPWEEEERGRTCEAERCKGTEGQELQPRCWVAQPWQRCVRKT